MTLYDRLKADNARILSSDDMMVLTLTNLAGVSYTGRGRITNPGMTFNPQGQPVASQKISIAFSLETFSPLLTMSEINNGGNGWKAQFDNEVATGLIDPVEGRVNLFLVNKTFGHVEATLTRIK